MGEEKDSNPLVDKQEKKTPQLFRYGGKLPGRDLGTGNRINREHSGY
jgi:hypothetical protein